MNVPNGAFCMEFLDFREHSKGICSVYKLLISLTNYVFSCHFPKRPCIYKFDDLRQFYHFTPFNWELERMKTCVRERKKWHENNKFCKTNMWKGKKEENENKRVGYSVGIWWKESPDLKEQKWKTMKLKKRDNFSTSFPPFYKSFF